MEHRYCQSGEPSLLGTVDTPGTAEDVVVINEYAYVADGAFGLQSINVQNPYAPVIAGRAETLAEKNLVAMIRFFGNARVARAMGSSQRKGVFFTAL